MHSAWYRANAVLTLASTVLTALFGFATFIGAGRISSCRALKLSSDFAYVAMTATEQPADVRCLWRLCRLLPQR